MWWCEIRKILVDLSWNAPGGTGGHVPPVVSVHFFFTHHQIVPLWKGFSTIVVNTIRYGHMMTSGVGTIFWLGGFT